MAEISQPATSIIPPGAYPASFSVDYPEGKRKRLSAAFRVLLAIPVAIVVMVLSGVDLDWNAWDSSVRSGANWRFGLNAAAALFLATLLMVLFRRKYPRWWFDWTLNLSRFSNRVGAYVFLLRDEYPSTDEEQAVHVNLIYPDAAKDLNRWLPLVKWFLAIPHYVVLVFLGIAAIVCTIVAWFTIVFAATYPRAMFDFVVGVARWEFRVFAYAFYLVTDRYPPFSLK